MATWWSLDITGEPNETDLEHIADLVKEGFTSGQLLDDDSDGTFTEDDQGNWHRVGS